MGLDGRPRRRRRADHRSARPTSPPRRPTSWSSDAGLDRRARARCWPASAGPGWPCPAATTSAPGPSTCTCRRSSALGATFDVAHGYIEARADQLVGARHPARVPERRRHRERADGGGAGQGHDGHRQRRPRARDRRPGRVPQPHGRQHRRRGQLDDRRSRASTSCTGRAHGDPRPHRGGHVPRRASAWPAARSPLEGARPDHMDMLVHKLGDMGMRISPDRRRRCGRMAPGPAARRSTCRRCRTRASPPTTSRCSWPCWRWPTASASSPRTSSPGRFRYVDELVRMGADIRTEGHHAVVRGVARLSGRAGAGPRHPGRRRPRRRRAGAPRARPWSADAHHIDRGYERFVEKLAGARRRRRAQCRAALRRRRSARRARRRPRPAGSSSGVGPPVGHPQQPGERRRPARRPSGSRPSRPGGRRPADPAVFTGGNRPVPRGCG